MDIIAQTTELLDEIGDISADRPEIAALLDTDPDVLIVAAMTRLGHRIMQEEQDECGDNTPHDCGARVDVYETALTSLYEAYNSTEPK